MLVEACGILVSWSGIEPRPLALGARSLSHWTTRKVPFIYFKWTICSWKWVLLYSTVILTIQLWPLMTYEKVIRDFFIAKRSYDLHGAFTLSLEWFLFGSGAPTCDVWLLLRLWSLLISASLLPSECQYHCSKDPLLRLCVIDLFSPWCCHLLS